MRWGGLYVEMMVCVRLYIEMIVHACVRWGGLHRDDRWGKAVCKDDGMCKVGRMIVHANKVGKAVCRDDST